MNNEQPRTSEFRLDKRIFEQPRTSRNGPARFPKPGVGGSNPSRRTLKAPANAGKRRASVSRRGSSDTTLTPPGLSEGSIHRTGCSVSHVGEYVQVDIL